MRGFQPATVLDVGCGTGTLGIALAKASSTGLIATDRDALACWFTELNARENGVACRTSPTLGVLTNHTSSATEPVLAVCNIPAKAGDPVIRSLIRTIVRRRAEEMLCGFVIVKPLERILKDEIERPGIKVVATHSTGGHRVCVAQVASGDRQLVGTDDDNDPRSVRDGVVDIPTAYVRGYHQFDGVHGSYAFRAVHNVPEFDSLGYDTQLAFHMLRRHEPGGRIAIWGSPHIALGCVRPSKRTTLHVMGRDVLQVSNGVWNVRTNSPELVARGIVAPALSRGLEASIGPALLDWLIVSSTPEPGSLWTDEIRWSADYALAETGHLLVVSKSSSISRLEPVVRAGFHRLDTRRSNGYRADLFRRKTLTFAAGF